MPDEKNWLLLCYTYIMEFEWDYKKAVTNAKKHLVTFDEAITCFYDPHQIAFCDPDHSEDEDRDAIGCY